MPRAAPCRSKVTSLFSAEGAVRITTSLSCSRINTEPPGPKPRCLSHLAGNVTVKAFLPCFTSFLSMFYIVYNKYKKYISISLGNQYIGGNEHEPTRTNPHTRLQNSRTIR